MKHRHISWVLTVALFSLGWILLYANRTILSPVLSVLEQEWNLDRTGLGIMSSAFFLLYAIFQVPSGMLADRIGRKAVLVPGFLLQGLAQIASGLAAPPGFFLFSRAVAGAGQGTYYSTQYALSLASLPPERRALGSAIINSGMSVGIAFGMALASFLVFTMGLGWRLPFVVLGTASLVLATAIGWLIPEPRRSAVAGQGEETGTDVPPAGTTARTLAFVAIFNLTTMYGFYVILTWLPYYLKEVRGFTGGLAGLVSTIMPLVAIGAALLAGGLSDRLGRRRAVMMLALPLAALSLILLVTARSRIGIVLAMALYGLGGKLTTDPLMVSLVAEATPRRKYATSFAVLNVAGTISMVLAPAITGYLSELLKSFNVAFYLAAALNIVALGAIWLVPESGRRSSEGNCGA
ncbi:MAG: MFS transporter [Bacillota bacterium]